MKIHTYVNAWIAPAGASKVARELKAAVGEAALEAERVTGIRAKRAGKHKRKKNKPN